jgi:hypothetical protein
LNGTDGDTSFEMEPWKVISCYHDQEMNVLYHLHPELVELINGIPMTLFCPRCDKAQKDGKSSDYSIAAGIDFGSYHRIPGLEVPNLHEELIISKYRLYQCVVKLLGNGRYNQGNYTIQSIKGSQILFLQDSGKVVPAALKTAAYIDGLMHVMLYGPDGLIDRMAQNAYGTASLYARSFVLRKWFSLLNYICNGYGISETEILEIIRNTVKSIDNQKSHAIVVSDLESLQYEANLGSDVAQSQQVDPMVVDRDDMNRNEVAADGDIPYRTHFVTTSPEQLLAKENIVNQIVIGATRDLLTGRRKENNDDFVLPEQSTQETVLDSVGETVDDSTRAGRVEQIMADIFGLDESNDVTVGVHRSANPVSELKKDDVVLTGAFPEVFLLGKAYGRPPGALSYEQRNHLLKQFTLIPARNRRLLGYLADATRRLEVIRGAKLRIAGNKQAVERINAFIERANLSTDLQEAQKNPKGKVAKTIWKAIEPYLLLAGGNILYSALESSRCLTRICEQSR